MRHRRQEQGESGVTVIELVAALAVFALLFLMVDAMFFAANRGSKKAELAADVQQNARIAMERLIREVRESGATSGDIVIGGTTGARSIIFRSARLVADNSVFCLYVRYTTDPSYMYNSGCFTSFITPLVGPPYASSPTAPLGTYKPIWQRYVAYFIENGELRRRTVQLDSPTMLLTGIPLSGGDVIATYVETFDVSQSSARLTMSLKARGQNVVQGSAVPAQEILLDATVQVRN